MYYSSELENLHDDIQIDQLELDWIALQRDFAFNKAWGDSRTSILEAMECSTTCYGEMGAYAQENGYTWGKDRRKRILG